MNTRLFRLGLIVSIWCAVLAAAAVPVRAAGTFTVTKTADTDDGDCDADCSLREAIAAANAEAGPNVINVPPGTYALSLGKLVVGSIDNLEVTIQSTGTADNTVIQQTTATRVLEMSVDQNLHVTLKGLTLANGTGTGVPTGGGGILGGGTGQVLDVIECIVRDNGALAGNGGGIQFSPAGNLNVVRSVIANNTDVGQGGAIYFRGGTLTVQYSRIYNNAGQYSIYVFAGTGLIDDNWWGQNSGPLFGETFNATFSRWLQMRHSASPGTIDLDSVTTLTADIFGRNSDGPIDPALLNGLPAFPAGAATSRFSNALNGTLYNAATTFINGTATADFVSGAVHAGNGSADVSVDAQTVNAAITINNTTPTATTSRKTGNWTDVTAWTSGVPSASKDATILNGHTLTLNANGWTRNFTVNSGGGFNAGANQLTVSGNLSNDGAFAAGTGTLIFNAGGSQNLTANVATTLHHVTVNSGATVIETVAADNVTLGGTLTNHGTLRKAKSIGAGGNTLGLAGAAFTVTTLGNLASWQADRIGAPIPNGIDSFFDIYYEVSANVSDGSFAGTLCLSYTAEEYAVMAARIANPDENKLRLCRWTGAAWACPERAASSSPVSKRVCADNVSGFSRWGIGQVGPTALVLRDLTATSATGGTWLVFVSLGLLGVVLLRYVLRRL